MATTFDQVAIGGADRKADVLRVELWRTVSAVGNWMAVLRNTGGTYNGVFDVQDQFLIDVNAPAATLMQGRVEGPDCVMSRGVDRDSDWDEYIILRGVDQAQDLLFHNDFEYLYPDTAQQVKTVWNDVINTQLSGLTNITYAPPVGATPVVGAYEFREGTNFLASTQELFRRAGFIWYVDDALAFQSGAPGFSASGVILRSTAGGANNNILDIVDLTERDGDKLYDYIKLYGKNPMFDGYTEQNIGSWSSLPAGQLADDTATVRVGTYSNMAYNNNPVNTHLSLIYDLWNAAGTGNNNYTSFDFTKGEVGVWCYYDDTAGAPGTPGAGTMGAGGPGGVWPFAPGGPTCLWLRLTDSAGRTAEYFGTSTIVYRGYWCWCSFPLGEDGGAVAALQNEWFLSNPAFDWSDIAGTVASPAMWFRIRPPGGFAAANYPSHLYLDGLTIPEPCIAVADGATGVMTNGTGTIIGSPLDLIRGLNQPTVTVAGTFTIDLPCSATGTAVSNGWVVQDSPVTLNPGTNTITVLGGGAGVIDVTLGSLYRRRPYVDYYSHIGTQNALDTVATSLLAQHGCTAIDKVKITTEGNIALRYAGQSVTVNVPALGLNNEVMYMTSIHHIIEPYTDVSDGFGFDWITEIEAVPTSGVEYDMNRLRIGSSFSSTQRNERLGTGLRRK